jgi:zinc transport system substrate-binding protein
VSGLLLASCSSSDDSSSQSFQVVGNFYPVVWLAQEIAGDSARVNSLTPDGVEPHDLTLDAKSRALLEEADLILYLGSDFQPDVEKSVANLQDQSKAIDLLKAPGVFLLNAEVKDDHDHAHEDDHKDDHDHAHEDDHKDDHDHAHEDEEEHKHPLAGGKDPHVWLDPTIMTSMAKAIASAMSAVLPEAQETFNSNLAALVGELEALDVEIRQSLAQCEIKTMVTSHAAFFYFTERYGFKQVPILGISPEDEPNAQRIASIAKVAKEAKVRTVYFEEVLSPDLAETVAREVGAETSLLSALEFRPENGDYLDQMRVNLANLVKGQKCA